MLSLSSCASPAIRHRDAAQSLSSAARCGPGTLDWVNQGDRSPRSLALVAAALAAVVRSFRVIKGERRGAQRDIDDDDGQAE